VSIGGGYALASGRKLWLVSEERAKVDVEVCAWREQAEEACAA
jgi:hypothetical protein